MPNICSINRLNPTNDMWWVSLEIKALILDTKYEIPRNYCPSFEPLDIILLYKQNVVVTL